MKRPKHGVIERLALGCHQSTMEPGYLSLMALMGLPYQIAYRGGGFIDELPGKLACDGWAAESCIE